MSQKGGSLADSGKRGHTHQLIYFTHSIYDYLLEKLRAIYNNIDFDVNFTDEIINLASNEVDIAIRAAATLPEQVVARRLGEHDFVLVATPV